MTSLQRRLRLVIRGDDEDTRNLFVRLSPGVPHDLLTRARRVTNHQKYDSTSDLPDDDLSWRLDTSLGGNLTCGDDDPTFLPLCIKFDGKDDVTIIYASYNGGTHAGSKKDTGNEGMYIDRHCLFWAFGFSCAVSWSMIDSVFEINCHYIRIFCVDMLPLLPSF